MAKAIMIQGTASDVGKTIFTLALCRIFKQDGYRVAPFKPQNITANSYIMEDGKEVAVSSWLQALAGGIPISTDMNPILLKPRPNKQGVQVIVNGRDFDTANLYQFKNVKERLIPELMAAYARLCAAYDIVVIEGAGSPVELNLNQDDIVNMGMAKRAKAPVMLLSDIDRGGVFASLYGTYQLLTDAEKAYVKGMVVNRFKGEVDLFKDGVTILEEITGLPVVGVVPFIKIDLPEEDRFDDRVNHCAYTADYEEYTADYEEQFERIAATVRKSLDMDLLYKILQDGIDA